MQKDPSTCRECLEVWAKEFTAADGHIGSLSPPDSPAVFKQLASLGVGVLEDLQWAFAKPTSHARN